MTTYDPAHLQALRAELDAQHATLWRQISLSPAWQQLQQLEARLAFLAELIGEEERLVGEPATPPVPAPGG